MSRKFLVSIDLTKNELQNAVIQNLASAPSSPSAGQIYYDTATNEGYIYNGSTWVSLSGATLTYGNVTAQTTFGAASANGVATSVSRSDHTHGTPALTSNAPSTQAIGDTAVVGTGTAPARDDHKHAMPSFGSVTAQTSFGSASGNGSSANIARADHTHGTPTHDNAAHSSINLSALAAPIADVSFGNFKITAVGTPLNASDAATKQYVDDVAQGLHIHASCVSATTANLTATYNNGSSGVGATLTNSGTQAALVIDGVTLNTNDRVLVKNQTAQLQNGIYVVTDTGSGSTNWILTRASDFDTSAEVNGGDFVFVTGGTVGDNTGWVQTSTPVTIGTTAIVFQQFSGAGTYLAGNGLTLTGNTFSFNPTSTGGLQAAVGGASILKPTNSGLVTDATGLYVGAGTGISVSGTSVAIDTTVVPRKFAQTLSTSATSYTITHNLGTLDVLVQVYTVSDGSEVVVDNLRATTNTVTLNFAVAPSANAYRVVIIG